MIRYKNCLARDIKLVYNIPNYGYVVFNLTNKKIVKINSLEQLKVYYGDNAVLVDAIKGKVMRANTKYNLVVNDRVVFENRCPSLGLIGHIYTFNLRDMTAHPSIDDVNTYYYALTINRLLSTHLCYMVFFSRFLLHNYINDRTSLLANDEFVPNPVFLPIMHPRIPVELELEIVERCASSFRIGVENLTYETRQRERRLVGNVLYHFGYHIALVDTESESANGSHIHTDSAENTNPNSYRTNLLHGYHSGPTDIHYYKTDSDTSPNPRYLGIELETEMTNARELDYTNSIHEYFNPSGVENEFIKMERDGSLRDGCEIIFQPMTLAYILEHKEFLRGGLKLIEDSGGTSHDNGRCGLHVHVARASLTPDAVDNLYTMFAVFEKELTLFSRRTTFNYCAFMRFGNLIYDHIPFVDKEYISYHKTTGHNCALNNQHSNTLEFRIFRGTTNFRTFIATLCLVNNMCEIAMSKSNLNGLTWNDIINRNNYTELKEYNASKHIDGSKVYNEMINLRERSLD